MDIEHFTLEVDHGVAVVTLDRPPVNAQDRRTREELIWIIDSLSDRDDVRAVILTGAGKVFSAGADLGERAKLADVPGEYLRHNRIVRESFFVLTDCAKPVIAAINGPAIGAGFALAASCDILVCSDNAYIQMPEVDLAMAGGAKFLTRHLPRSASRLLFFTGRRMYAPDMYRHGLVEQVVPRDDLLPTALGLAGEIARKSPLAVAKNKAAFNVVEGLTDREGYRYEQGLTRELSTSADALEARTAFLEKREPRFTGR
jgi:enoyl-CoA hydratase